MRMNLASLPLRFFATLVSWLLRAAAYVVVLWIVEAEVSYGTSLTGRQILEALVWTILVAVFVAIDRRAEDLRENALRSLKVVLGVLVASALVVAISAHETIGQDATLVLLAFFIVGSLWLSIYSSRLKVYIMATAAAVSAIVLAWTVAVVGSSATSGPVARTLDSLPGPNLNPDPPTLTAALAAVILVAAPLALLNAWRIGSTGQTLVMKLFRLKVVGIQDRDPIGIRQSVWRSTLFLLMQSRNLFSLNFQALLEIVRRPLRQGFHDEAVKAIVVRS